MPVEVRIEAVEFHGRAYWQVRLGRRALRFPMRTQPAPSPLSCT